jgi:hypothetical protein
VELDKVVKSQVQRVYPGKFRDCDRERVLSIVLFDCVRVDKEKIDFGESCGSVVWT